MHKSKVHRARRRHPRLQSRRRGAEMLTKHRMLTPRRLRRPRALPARPRRLRQRQARLQSGRRVSRLWLYLRQVPGPKFKNQHRLVLF